MTLDKDDLEAAQTEKARYEKQWRKDHPDQVREIARRWRSKNRDRLNDYARQWRANNPDKVKEYKLRYWLKKAKEAQL